MTLLCEVIDIPERVTQADFVTGLADAVAHKQRTLDQYVVTPQLAECFDKALGLVSQGLTTGSSQAAFLHGSFGSGKSHFMAVLYQLLRNDPDARGIPELAPVISRNDANLQGRNLLPLTYHLIGADNLETAILRGYFDQICARHPDSPIPAVHRSDSMLDNADQIRSQMGDDAFFKALNSGSDSASPGLGSLGTLAGRGTSWNAQSYAAARSSSPTDKARTRLVSDLTATLLPAFRDSRDFVDLDSGLAVMAQHAADLGYDGIVLFLDELILWLASHLGDQSFVSNEGAKLAKLVEAQDSRRTIPLISFVARQRDLVEFLGEHVPGAQKAAFGDVLSWSRGRFGDIRLEDRNLPLIAEKRLLKPKDANARAIIDDAFERIDRRPDVWDVLLTGTQVDGKSAGSDQESFRRTYPFSPALVATLVALSQALQRERTALKVMLQLLVNGRDALSVGDLVPVGDLYDVVVADEVDAVTPELKHQFDQARRLYTDRIRPVLLDIHGLNVDDLPNLGDGHPYRTDDRLAKTLIVAALAPDVPALSGLTASRLAALNHGTIAEWLPGQAAASALHKIKQLATNVGEIRVGDGDDPVLSVELTDVNPEEIIENARAVDNEGNRRRLLRELVWESLGITESNTLDDVQTEKIVWRGQTFLVDLVFGNVRDTDELPDRALVAVDGRWKVVVDYPFDDEDMSPASDMARIDGLAQDGMDSTTLFWIPSLFTGARMRDLGVLVVLNHLLDERADRFNQYAQHLNPVDRQQARALLKQRRDILTRQFQHFLKEAYGVANADPANIEKSSALATNFATLAPGLALQPPVGRSLGDAFRSLVHQSLSWSYPAHPDFHPTDQAVTAADLRKVLAYCERAYEAPANRVEIESRDRPLLRRICRPLELGSVGEAHFVLEATSFPWSKRLIQEAGRNGYQDHYPVAELLGYLDEPKPRGLSAPMSGLILRVFAMLNDLSWTRMGTTVPVPDIDRVTAHLELRQSRLPEQESWMAARACAREVFDQEIAELRSTNTVSRLADQVRERARDIAAAVRALDQQLAAHANDLDADPTHAHRWKTAAAVRSLVDWVVENTDDVGLVDRLASEVWPTSAAAAGRSLQTAGDVSQALSKAKWNMLRRVRAIDDDRRDEADAVQTNLADAASRDELSAPLIDALESAETRAAEILAQAPKTTSGKDAATGRDDDPSSGGHSGGSAQPQGQHTGEFDGTVAGLEDLVARLRQSVSAKGLPGTTRIVVTWRSQT